MHEFTMNDAGSKKVHKLHFTELSIAILIKDVDKALEHFIANRFEPRHDPGLNRWDRFIPSWAILVRFL